MRVTHGVYCGRSSCYVERKEEMGGRKGEGRCGRHQSFLYRDGGDNDNVGEQHESLELYIMRG